MALHHDILPWLKPAELLAFFAKNPLLLEAYPDLCARRAAEVEAGTRSAFDISVSARGMTTERTRLRLKLGYGYEGALGDQADWQRVNELLQASWIDGRERSTVRAFAMGCHASEWPWLIARLEEVITRRAEAEEVIPLAA